MATITITLIKKIFDWICELLEFLVILTYCIVWYVREEKRKRDPKRAAAASKVIPSSTRRCNVRHYRKYNTFSSPRQFPKISKSLSRKIPLLPHVDWPRRANYRTGFRQKWSVYNIKACRNLLLARVLPWLSAELCSLLLSSLYKWRKSTRELLTIEFITCPP